MRHSLETAGIPSRHAVHDVRSVLRSLNEPDDRRFRPAAGCVEMQQWLLHASTRRTAPRRARSRATR
ncbi:hypothetical protein BLAT2472_20154 [Burkholderia latens]